GHMTMVGNLRRPSPAGRYPLVLLLPGLDSTKEEFFHWENVFLTRGLATLSLDGPGQGETGEKMPIRPDYEAAVTVALDAVHGRLMPERQAERVVAQAPNATLVMYPEGNHACNNIPYKYRPLVGDWMAEQLRADA